ncbi:MAG TPA: hypothetical protein EYP55_03330 [Anaerolineae bacterium]|nr:hypothetical protein [Anaerolineae bacterium]
MARATLEKIRSLERIYEMNYGDEFLDQALDKIISHELSRDQESLNALQEDLNSLEEKYGLSSEEFFEKFQKGQLEDTADFMEWNALYKMYSRLKNRLSILQGHERE